MQGPKGTRLMFSLPPADAAKADRTRLFGARMTQIMTRNKPAPDRAIPVADPVYTGRVIRVKSKGDIQQVYQIGEQIGEGGLAYVYKGTRVGDREEVAIKILKLDVQEERVKERFLAEGFFLTQFDHPNILKCYGALKQDNTVYLIIELLKGDTLTNILRQIKLSVQDAVAVTLLIIDGLEEAHSAGVVHRDLKPENIFVCEDGTLKIIDFGVSRVEGGTGFGFTAKGTTLGTAEYMAPEQISDSNVDARADIYSLGIILYEMLAGAVPFTNENRDEQTRIMAIMMRHLNEKPKPIKDANQRVSEQLESLVSKLLAKNKDERYRTAIEVKEDLERLRDNGLLEAEPSKARGLLARLFAVGSGKGRE